MGTTVDSKRRRRVVIYCRISDDREGKRWGVDRQERVCRERAEANGWDVVAVLVENDVSAYSGKARPKYAVLLAMLDRDQADAVLALSNKRLSRRINEAFAFLDLVESRDIAVDTIKAGAYNLNTAEGRGQARRAAVDAQEESEEIGERVRDAKRDNVEDGTYRGGPRPFGYEADGTTPRALQCPGCAGLEGFTADRECKACGTAAVNEPGTESWWAEWATDQVLARRSLRGICAELVRAGIQTVPRRGRDEDGNRTEATPKDWISETLRPMLLRPRNAGLMEDHGEITGKAAWPAIVPEDKWRACRALLKNPDRRTTAPTTARKWLGSSLFRCGVEGCTATMETTGSGKGWTDYRHLGHVTRSAEPVDAFVSWWMIRRLSRPDAAALLHPPKVEDGRDLSAEANALRVKLDGYAEDYDRDLITRKQMVDGTARTRAKLEDVERGMALRAVPPVLAGVPLGTDLETVRKAWQGYDLDRKRAIIDTLYTVTIMPAGSGRPPRVEIDGKFYNFDTGSVLFDRK